MMTRITVKDVRQAFKAMVEHAETVGVKRRSEEWMLEEGSQINGRGWRVYAKGQNGGLEQPVIGDYLGWTAKEAYDVLWAYSNAFTAVEMMQRAKIDDIISQGL